MICLTSRIRATAFSPARFFRLTDTQGSPFRREIEARSLKVSATVAMSDR